MTNFSKKNGIVPVKKNINRWILYDRLIAGIPDELFVEECVVGIHWTLVRSQAGVGLAMSPISGERSMAKAGMITGKPLGEIAKLSKSWNAAEAALGVAAINSYYNAPSVLSRSWGDISNRQSNESVFAVIGPEVKGKNVTVVGHFPDLERLSTLCTLSILERNPQPGDLPDPACEYILQEQDYVFMTGVTLINKTMPRLLELSRGCKVVLVGPSVPLTPLFFDYGVSLLAGTVVLDINGICNHVAEGGDRSIFHNGAMMIRLKKENCIEKRDVIE